MKRIKLYESFPWKNKLVDDNEYPTADDVVDYFINKVDEGSIEIDSYRTQEELDFEFNQIHSVNKKNIYFENKPVDKFSKKEYSERINALVYLKASIPHPPGVRGSLFVIGYTTDILQYYLKKFVERSGHKVNIIVGIERTNNYNNPLSTSIVRIEFLD